MTLPSRTPLDPDDPLATERTRSGPRAVGTTPLELRGGERNGSAHGEKLLRLSTGEPADPVILERLNEIAALPYVASVLALPDLHYKDQMEVPSSIAIATRGVIVPEFTSVAVNDGMGVVRTGLDEKELTAEKLHAFLQRVNSHTAANPMDVNRYSLSQKDLVQVLVHGARGVLSRYQLPDETLQAMEHGGAIRTEGDLAPALGRAVPAALLASRFSRSEMGLNFGGNHFLEVQVVDGVMDEAVATSWGLAVGQVVVMYHLGPGPFSGTLLHHYSRRTKIDKERVPAFFLSKLLFHYGQRFGQSSVARKWALHFRQNGWTPYPEDSEDGRLMRQAMALAMNFGSAYRLATVRAILDGLEETVKPGLPARLLCDVSHNGVWSEEIRGERLWVARHNACTLTPGSPTIVAGSYDIPSYLGIGGDGGDGTVYSYDHGAGHLIDESRKDGKLVAGPHTVERLRMTRGRDARLVDVRQATVYAPEPIDRLMSCLERHRVMTPVVRLRPIANLKN